MRADLRGFLKNLYYSQFIMLELATGQGSSMVEHRIHNAAVVGSIPTPATGML